MKQTKQTVYSCEYCGRQSTNKASISNHKAWCEKNPTSKQRKERFSKTLRGINIDRDNNVKTLYQFNCKLCGKEYQLQLTKYKYQNDDYTKFCSRSCANRRIHSQETKRKISRTASDPNGKVKKTIKARMFPRIKRQCLICGKIMTITEHSLRKFCSNECSIQGQKLNLYNYTKPRGRPKGIYNPAGCWWSKQGWYKGIHCNSTWQLAYVVYCLQHNIKIERNNKGFPYLLDDQKELYFYPDFIINDKDFVQVKGYKDKRWKYKLKYFPHHIQVVDTEKIDKYIDYVEQKYGKDYIKLFEKENNKGVKN